jgi:hypothetical protein
VRIFKTKLFARFARRERIADANLCEAVERAGRGLVDADLGGGLIKQRVAREGQGRSGGYRALLAFRLKDRTVFIYGFAKNDRDNIDDLELAVARKVSASWLAADTGQIGRALAQGLLIEVKNDG